MSVTIVVGGQYGSEGKGKVVSLEARRAKAPHVVRCGGPNSGHTIVHDGRPIVLRQVPSGVGNRNALLLIGPGCALDPDVLAYEVKVLGVPRERLVVDPRAVVVTERDREAEADWSKAIGSTASGTGAALVRRMHRPGRSILAESSEQVRSLARLESVPELCHELIDLGGDVIVEGTQGFGLSLFHGDYPYVTARDTTAAGFVSEVGIAPHQVTRVVMTLRTFPIRVGGDSGPLHEEITWEDVQRLGRAPQLVTEYTSVTKRLRRVGMFDWDLARRAQRINRPTSVALMGIDRLAYENTRAAAAGSLTPDAIAFVRRLERELGTKIEWIGTGFGDDALHVQGDLG